jgi:outer membrane cobalamin receptor
MAALSLLQAEELAQHHAFLELPTLVLKSQETANERSAVTYTTPVSNLEFDPRIDLQSRNMAEAQGDITIRGGIFENTGIRLGSATLIDPQTGHYFAELPIAPEMLKPYQVFTGADNALYGFNSTVGTISYGWSEIKTGGSATAGAGDHGLNFQRLHQGWATPLGDSGQWTLGVEAEYSRSESDGSINFGDHDFYRTTGRVQLVGPSSQTDLFAGYQEKFFGWFGMYTGRAFAASSPFETENLKTRLFLANHRQAYGDASWFEATAYYREHSDHYIFNRFAPNDNFIHDTKVTSLGLSGQHAFDDAFALNYSGQATDDSIDSTNLENNFTSRSYHKFSLVPQYQLQFDSNDTVTLRAGASYYDTNRNSSEVSAIADIAWERIESDGTSKKVYLSYAEASQVTGYTAVGGGTAGLFASNPNLDTETSQNLELGGTLNRANWSLNAAVFYRWDDDLTDWTFDSASPSARTANPVDLETFGVELIATKQWKRFEAIVSYTYLDKEEDYGPRTADASFYALNFAKHRITLGGIWRPFDWVILRVDNEWRDQQENALRNSDDTALFTHIGVSFYPPQIENLELFLAGENIWEENFEDVPGTPGRGDQYSVGVRYSW